MTIHLVKLAVGVTDLDDFDQRIERRLAEAREQNQPQVIRHLTRHTPRRSAELTSGGSLYWVVKGAIRARQRLLALEPWRDDDGLRCALVLDGTLTRTVARPHQPFQGWRYLRPEAAPPDAAGDVPATMPATMLADLKSLGLV